MILSLQKYSHDLLQIQYNNGSKQLDIRHNSHNSHKSGEEMFNSDSLGITFAELKVICEFTGIGYMVIGNNSASINFNKTESSSHES